MATNPNDKTQKKFKVVSFRKRLEQKYGGKWKHKLNEGWYCDDNIRYVKNVSAFNYSLTDSDEFRSETWLYYSDNSKLPEMVFV